MKTTIVVVLIWVAIAAAVGTVRLPAESSLLGNVAVALALLTAAGGAIAVTTRSQIRSEEVVSRSLNVVAEDDECADDDDVPFDENVVQQWSRKRDDNGVERIEAMLRADFAPRQQVTTLHIPFCPPFASTPEVVATPLDGDGVTIQVVRCLPTGARLDVKRPVTHQNAASHWIVAEVTQ
ncbi:MAG: hypothetical protein ACRC46_07970 [Thermoguttaceae bacterium]